MTCERSTSGGPLFSPICLTTRREDNSLTARYQALVLDLDLLSVITKLNISRHASECHECVPQDVWVSMAYVIKINALHYAAYLFF